MLAADGAWFQAPFRNLASAPDSGLTWLLPRVIGTMCARRVLLGAEKVDAKTARDWGLVGEVVAAERLPERAKEVALSYAAGATIALREIKALINDGLRWDLNTTLDTEARAVSSTARTKDNQAALRMFASKDLPVFTGE